MNVAKALVIGLAVLAAAPEIGRPDAGRPGTPTPDRPGAAKEQTQAQERILENERLASRILGRDVDYGVYLPPDYFETTRRYPVVFLLHGLSDDESGWIQFGELPQAADRAIAGRVIPPMIVVMPDAGATFYINDYQGKVRYEDFLLEELIPHIDGIYRTRPTREFRGVAGLSMGGWGALTLSMRHSDRFSACAAFSAAVWTEEDAAAMEGPVAERFAGLFGPKPAEKGAVAPHFKATNPLSLARDVADTELRKVRYYIDCGDDDFLIRGNCALHLALLERKIPHEFRVRDGAHTWTYWRTGIVDGLEFIGRGFHR